MQSLTNEQEVDTLINSDEPVWLFKHSTTCPVSARAMAQFERYIEQHPDEPVGFVIIQQHRPVSSYVAEELGIRHESPQLFLVQRGQALWHTSHGGITAGAMATNRARVVDDAP